MLHFPRDTIARGCARAVTNRGWFVAPIDLAGALVLGLEMTAVCWLVRTWAGSAWTQEIVAHLPRLNLQQEN